MSRPHPRDWVPAAVCLVGLLAGCGKSPAGEVQQQSEAPSTSSESIPCDPGAGFPQPRATCPDAHPVIGWLSRGEGGLLLSTFRTLGNDAAGHEYAEEHGEDFPFSNDYFDAPTGTHAPLILDRTTACTGIILVDYRSPMEDHVVPCTELVAVTAADRRLPVAVWTSDDIVVQVSELYRP